MGVTQSQIDLLIRMRAEGADTIDLFSGAVTKAGEAGVAAADGLDRADASIKNVGDDSVAAAVAVGAFAEGVGEKLVHLGEDILLTSARTQGLAAVAEFLGTKTGLTRTQVDALVNSIHAQGVSAQEANNLVIQLARNNLGLENATRLATVAQNAAFIAGESTAEALQQIITGIVELQPRLLKTAGLVVSFEQAESQLAHTLGTNAAALTEHQKQQAALNAVLDAGVPIAGVYALSMQFVGKQLTSLPRLEQDAANAMGQQLLPAFGLGVTAFSEFLKVIAKIPSVFDTLGVSIVGVAGPLLLAKGAALLGIPTFAELGTAITAIGASMTLEIDTFADFRTAIQITGETAGITTAKLGLLGSAGAAAAAGFVGWQIGRVIADLFGLDEQIDDTITHIHSLQAARNMAGGVNATQVSLTKELTDLQNQYNQSVKDGNSQEMIRLTDQIHAVQGDQTRAAMLDTINRAIATGAPAWVTYGAAIQHNTDVVTANNAAHNTSLATQRAVVEAELRLGQITADSANAQLAAIAAEEHANLVRASRQKYTDVATLAEKQFRAELDATGYSEKELTSLFASDPVTFERWAKSVNLSQDTIKRLKDEVASQKEAQKQATEEAKKWNAVVDEMTSAGDGWRGTLAGMSDATIANAKAALAAGVAQDSVAKYYGITATQVKAVGKELQQETADQKAAEEENKKFQKAVEDMNLVGDDWNATLADMSDNTIASVKAGLAAGATQQDLAEFYGLTAAQIRAVSKALQEENTIDTVTAQSVTQTKELWNEYFDSVSKGSSTAVDYQIGQVQRWADNEIAKLKVDDQNWTEHYDAIVAVAQKRTADLIAAADPLNVAWKGINEDMRGDWASTWEKALHGETSFAVAALEPFKDLRDGLGKIFAAILADFEAQLLNPLLGLAHQGIGWLLKQLDMGATGGAGASPFGGASASTGLLSLGAGFGLKGLGIGGATAASGLPGTVVPASVYGSMPGTTAGAAAGSSLTGVAGGAGAGLAAFFTGQFIGNTFGHTAGVIGGAAAGAGEGALIGSVVPGLGTAVGALVGGAAGLIGGIFSGGKGRAADQTANATLATTQTQLLQTYGSLQNIDLLGKQVGIDLADAWGDKGAKGLAHFQDTVLAFTAKVTTLQAAVQQYGLTWTDLIGDKGDTAFRNQAATLSSSYSMLLGAGYDPTTVVKDMGGDLNQLVQVAETTGQKIPQSLQPILNQLVRMGGLTKQNSALLLGIAPTTTASFDDITAAAGRYGITLDQLGPKVNQLNIEQSAQQLSADWTTLSADGEDVNQVMMHMKDGVQGVIDNAAKMGLQIPSSMKPMIDAMTNAGLLTDGFGNALTDDSKLNWEKPLSDDIDTLVTKMDALITAIVGPGGVGDALDNVGNRKYQPTISPKIEWPDGTAPDVGWAGGGSGADDTPRPGGAASGIFTNHPTLAIFGEGGEPELGGPVDFMAKALSGALALATMGGGGVATAAAPDRTPIQIHISAKELQNAIRFGAPIMVQAFADNVGGSKTDLRRVIK